MDGSENDFNGSKRPVSLSKPLVDTYWTCTSKQLIWHPAKYPSYGNKSGWQ